MREVVWLRDVEGYSNTYGCRIVKGEAATLDDERAARAIAAGVARDQAAPVPSQPKAKPKGKARKEE